MKCTLPFAETGLWSKGSKGRNAGYGCVCKCLCVWQAFTLWWGALSNLWHPARRESKRVCVGVFRWKRFDSMRRKSVEREAVLMDQDPWNGKGGGGCGSRKSVRGWSLIKMTRKSEIEVSQYRQTWKFAGVSICSMALRMCVFMCAHAFWKEKLDWVMVGVFQVAEAEVKGAQETEVLAREGFK